MVAACDVCGTFVGMNQLEQKSAIGLNYRYTTYAGTKVTSGTYFPASLLRNSNGVNQIAHTGHTSVQQKDFEVFRSIELRVKYFMHHRIEFNTSIPFLSNEMRYGVALIQNRGIGDANVWGAYHLIMPNRLLVLQQNLNIGIGIKLPTGAYNKITAPVSIGLLEQLGSGSTDLFLNLAYNLQKNKSILLLSGSYRVNGSNKLGQSIANLSFFNFQYQYQFNQNKVWLMPFVNLMSEYTKGINFEATLQPESAMGMLAIGTGIDLRYKRMNINLQFAKAVKSFVAENAIQPIQRLGLSLRYTFDQQQYLVPSKKG
ncbi:MAG: hypothetical protein RIQ89_366 [Bacteroidota bacterium]